MENEVDIQGEIHRFFLILLRRKWILFGMLILILIPVVYYNEMTPHIYKASVKIKYEEKDFGISDGNLVQFKMNQNYIENLIHEINSYTIMNAVVRQFPDSILNNFIESYGIERDEYLIPNITYALKKSVSARPLIKSDIISIDVESQSRHSAVYIANKIAELIRQRNRDELLGDVNQVRNTVEEQLTYFEAKVKTSENALKRFKEENKITNLNEESQEIFKRITEAETRHNQVITELDAAQKRLEFVKEKLRREREDLVEAITTTTSPRATRLKEQLVDLEVQYTTLKVQSYADEHPKMKELKEQIQETKRNLEKETLKIAMGETTIDPLSEIQKNLSEIAELEVDIHTYQAQKNALSNILYEYNINLETLPEKELALGRLTRDKAVADKIYTMLLEKREEARIQEAEKTGNIYIIDRAQLPREPVKPRKKLNLIIGFFLGVNLGVGLALVIELMNKKIYTMSDLEKTVPYEVIGNIPKIPKQKYSCEEGNTHNASDLICLLDPKAPVAEAFRALRTNMHSAIKGDSYLSTFLITGATPGIGKSMIAANLAISYAQLGHRTLLIDADLRKPMIDKLFNINRNPGLTDLLQVLGEANSLNKMIDKELKENENKNKEAIKAAEFIRPTSIENLSILPRGGMTEEPSELLSSETVNHLLKKFRLYFDAIIIDSSPILAVPDALSIIPNIDTILFVIRAGQNSMDEVKKSIKIIERFRHNHKLGIILNGINKRDDYYSHYYYHPQAPVHKKHESIKNLLKIAVNS